MEYFEKEQDRLSVVSPNTIDAIQIMTIHKSKGLEFPVVIFPFADLNIYKEIDPKIWFPVDESDYSGFETLLLNYTKDVEYFGETGEAIYNTHQSQLELDNINLLYVTLTRAVESLFVISKYDVDAKGNVNSNTFSGMFIAYLKDIGLWADQQLNYSFGTFKRQAQIEAPSVTSDVLNLISVPKEYHNLRILTKAGQLWDTKQEKAIERGNLVHLILSKIKTTQDVDFAFSELLQSGDITNEDQIPLRELVSSVLEHPMLKAYFSNDYTIYNERDIITETGQLLRPDRLNINSENEVVIIDYKTGGQRHSTNHNYMHMPQY